MKLTTAIALSFTSAAIARTSHAGAAHGLLKRSASHSGSENRLVRRSRSAHQQYARQAEAAPSPANASHLAMPTTTAYNGTALWFNQTAGKQGACLTVNTDEDYVVGLPTQFWNDTTVPSPLCGSFLLIRNPENGLNITAKIADASGKQYTTLTIAAFRALGVSLATGMFDIEYTFLNSTNSSSTLPASLSAVTFAGVPGNVRVVSDSTPSSTAASSESASTTAPSTTEAAPSPSVDVAAQAAARASAAAAQASRDAQGARDAQAARDAQGARDAQAARDAQGARDAAAAAAAKAASDKAAADAKWAAEQAEKNKPAPAPSGGGGDTHSGGHATFYYQNGVTGACGSVGQDSDLIAAMDSRLYQRTPNGRSSLCDRRVRITRPDNGKSVTVRVADECPTCISANSIDLSVAAFRMIAAEAEGLVPITWQFV